MFQLRVVISHVAFCLAAASAALPAFAEAAPETYTAGGPILLHANIDQQWGGHTFSYLLEGEGSLFWSATAYNPDGKTWGSLIGQYPKPGTMASQLSTAIPIAGSDVRSMTQPLMLRSADGYIHVFIGSSHDSGNPNYSPGRIRYFRSVAPEDVSSFVDRSELLPHVPPYNAFHLRMNVGVSQDGARAALVVLAISKDGSVPFNTPVIFLAEKRGPDFVFREPVQYAEPMGLFYPQVAVVDEGVVIVGQLWDNYDRAITRLIHLDLEGNEVYREDIGADEDGNYWCLDLRPVAPDKWNELILYHNRYPKDRQDCRHEFWSYTPATKTLVRRNSIEVPEGQINYGKWIPVAAHRSLFLHNPSMGGFEVYDGDLLGGKVHQTVALPTTSPGALGLAGTAHTLVPNPLQGSLSTPGSAWFATDAIPHKNNPEERIRATLLLYRLSRVN